MLYDDLLMTLTLIDYSNLQFIAQQPYHSKIHYNHQAIYHIQLFIYRT